MTQEFLEKYGIKTISIFSEQSLDSVLIIKYKKSTKEDLKIKMKPYWIYNNQEIYDIIDKHHQIELRKKKLNIIESKLKKL